jgi:hypothetical protein
VIPAYASMHEMGGRIPSECGMIMANTFLSEHFPALQQTPSYDAWLFTHDWDLAYRYHRRVLKLLQWQSGGNTRWLLKAPNHLGHLPTLFATYPDARVVQTHRDPLKCMASATNLLGCLYWMRSDKAFDSSAFEDLIMGSATASRLANVMRQREEGVVPAARDWAAKRDGGARWRAVAPRLGERAHGAFAAVEHALLGERPHVVGGGPRAVADGELLAADRRDLARLLPRLAHEGLVELALLRAVDGERDGEERAPQREHREQHHCGDEPVLERHRGASPSRRERRRYPWPRTVSMRHASSPNFSRSRLMCTSITLVWGSKW